jgi:uridylate kinase
VLIGGRKGTDGNTTDSAVIWYARDYRSNADEIPVTVLKGIRVDGVYEGDPETNANAGRYAQISASTMLADYNRFAVVDRESLEIVVKSGLNMQVYRDAAHDIAHALDPQSAIGTTIYGAPVEAEFAS